MALVRHGETVWHDDNRYAGGSSDIDLTSAGREQAEALARWCRRYAPDAVISSPMRRAVETASPSAAAAGRTLRVVEALREVDFGLAEGRTLGELTDLDADMAHRFRADPVAHPFPGAEPPQAAAIRCENALRSVAAEFTGGRVLVISHSTLLRLALCQLLGLPVSWYRNLIPRLENAALTELTVPADSREFASLLSLNVHVPRST